MTSRCQRCPLWPRPTRLSASGAASTLQRMPTSLIPSAEEAAAAWGDRVRADRAQVEQYREEPERSDFYGPIAANFKADPRRTNDPVLNALLDLVQPGETWLDIGAGAGRLSLPIALKAKEVIALDASKGMLEILRECMSEYAVPNVRIVESRWPAADAPNADVALIAGVGNDIEEMGAFLDAMEASASRLCVAIQPSRPPASFAYPFWPRIHGVERVALPSLPELLALLLARGRIFDVRLFPRPAQSYDSFETLQRMLRVQTWVKPGSEKDAELEKAMRDMLGERDGRWSVGSQLVHIGLVIWAPS